MQKNEKSKKLHDMIFRPQEQLFHQVQQSASKSQPYS